MNYKDYLDSDVYSVVEVDGVKKIKLEYYFYNGDEGIQCVEFSNCYVDIPATREDCDMAEQMCLQFQEDYTEYEYEEYCGSALTRLMCMPVEDVCEDTLCGTYIDA